MGQNEVQTGLSQRGHVTGGTEGARSSFADQPRVVLSTQGDITRAEEAYALHAFYTWADLIDIPFFSSDNGGDFIVEYKNDLDEDEAGITRSIFFTKYILINRNTFPELGSGEKIESFRYFTYLHEIGHALGLTHPGPYNGSIPKEPFFLEDSTQYTIMSYLTNSEREPYQHGRTPSTPMLHDIAAIQSIYGAKMSTRDGNTTYGFGSNNGWTFNGIAYDPYDFEAHPGGFAFTIWDGGGIDTIDASRFPSMELLDQDGRDVSQTIRLTAGEYSSIGIRNNENSSFGIPLKNNVAIAFGVTIENALGGRGDDLIVGNNVANRLVGNSGDDEIRGGAGDDTLDGGSGNDVLYGENGNDVLGGGDGNDRLLGGLADDILDGGAGDDTLSGGPGDDILIGGPGGDTLDGGAGFDIARFIGESGLRYRPSLLSYSGHARGDTFTSIEAFELSDGGDSFEGREEIDDIIDGNGGDDEIFGLGGNDTLRGGAGADTLHGGLGHDQLSGGPGNDTLNGGLGNDMLDGGPGADIMDGGQGGDSYYVDNPGDIIRESTLVIGGMPPDIVTASVDYALPAGVENLTLAGDAPLRGAGNHLGNLILGNGGDNVLDGRGGADIMRGGRGNDVYVVDDVGDVIDETGGTRSEVDTVQASISFNLAPSATVIGAVENLTLTGTAAINGTGNTLNNVLTGNGARNSLSGGAGNDTLVGGGGDDALLGGSGDDVYDFRTGASSTVELGTDTISDTEGTDTIRLDSMLQLVSAKRNGDSVTLSLRQGTVVIKEHFGKGQIENVRVDLKEVVLATGLIGGNASGIIPGSDTAELLDGRGGDDFLYGGGGNDILLGSEGDDFLQGDQGNDRLDGGAGLDTAKFSGERADYRLTLNPGRIDVTDWLTGRDGRDELIDVERIAFSDGTLALDLNGNAGQVYSLYTALLGRSPDSAGLGYFLRFLDAGGTSKAVAEAIIGSREYSEKGFSHAQLVNGLYATWLHRAPEQEGFDYWMARLTHGNAEADHGSVIANFLESPTVLQTAIATAPRDGLWYV